MTAECETCGAGVDDEGYALYGCPYGPNECEDCGGCICDGSC